MNGVGREMGVLDRAGDRQRGRAVLRVNLRRPIVSNGDLLRNCVGATRSSQTTSGGFVRHAQVVTSMRFAYEPPTSPVLFFLYTSTEAGPVADVGTWLQVRWIFSHIA